MKIRKYSDMRKQYLLDCGVETVSFGDGIDDVNNVWKESDVGKLCSDDFSMRMKYEVMIRGFFCEKKIWIVKK